MLRQLLSRDRMRFPKFMNCESVTKEFHYDSAKYTPSVMDYMSYYVNSAYKNEKKPLTKADYKTGEEKNYNHFKIMAQ